MVQAIKDLNEEPEYPLEKPPLLDDDERAEHEIAEEHIKGIRWYLYLLDFRQVTAHGVNYQHGAAMSDVAR